MISLILEKSDCSTTSESESYLCSGSSHGNALTHVNHDIICAYGSKVCVLKWITHKNCSQF